MFPRQKRRRRLHRAGLLCALLLTALASGCRSMQLPATDAAGNPIYAPAGGTMHGPPAVGGVPVQPPMVQPPLVHGGAPLKGPICPSDPHALPTSLPMPPPIVTPLTYEGLVLHPTRLVAPVGSEVILVATVYNKSGQPQANQRVEWMLSPESVGQFYDVGNRGQWFAHRHLRDTPRKVDNQFVIGSTRAHQQILTRGTPQTTDDVAIGRGQTWVSLSSAGEGTSYVTAFAPKVNTAFERQRQQATVYWVDAQFQFPAPIAAGVGTRPTLQTVVQRQSNGSPLAGWLVRYDVVEGEGTVFAPNGTSSIEVPTDAQGVAAVEVFQTAAARGSARIQVQVIRPQRDGERLVIGNGSTFVTWTAPDIGLQVIGPAQAEAGAVASYRIEVFNPGDVPLNEVLLTNRVPAGLAYLDSNPAADQSPSGLEWRLGGLGARQRRSVQVNYRVQSGGRIENCAEVRTAEGLTARDCAVMNAATPGPVPGTAVELDVQGVQAAAVGDEVVYRITVSNRGNVPASNLVIRNTFDPGLEHPRGLASPIVRDLGTLQPGAVRDDVAITLRVTRAGRLCQRIEISGDNVQTVSRQVCLTATATAPAEPGPVVPGDQSQPIPQASLRVEKQGPATARVGEALLFTTIVTNTGTAILRDVRIVDDYELGLEPTRAEPGHSFENDRLNWRIVELAPGESRRFRVECRATRAAPRACSRVTVSAIGGLMQADEHCLEIASGPSAPATPPAVGPGLGSPNGDPIGVQERGLNVSLTDLADEVPVGEFVTYVVRVTNTRGQSDRDVSVVVDFPEGLVPEDFGIVAPARHTISGRRLTFNPVAEIRPGEPLSYRFQARAERPGRVQVRVQVTSDRERQPLVATEETSIYVGR